MDISQDDLSDEKDCQHLAYYFDDEVVGCLKIKQVGDGEYQILQMAVMKDYQGKGIGTALLYDAETIIKEQEGINVVIEAREYAIPFYRKYGYTKSGKLYKKVNIPHQRMTKSV